MFEEELKKALSIGAKTAGQTLHDAQKRGNEELRRFEDVRR